MLYNPSIVTFSQTLFCNFHLEAQLSRHKLRNFRFCFTSRSAMWFSPLHRSDHFMGRYDLRFALSIIVYKL